MQAFYPSLDDIGLDGVDFVSIWGHSLCPRGHAFEAENEDNPPADTADLDNDTLLMSMSGCRTIPMPWYGKGWVPWGRRRQMTRDYGLLKLPSYKEGGLAEIFFWSFPLCLSNGNLWSNYSMYREEATAALSPCGYGARRLHHFEANTTTDIIDFFGLLILNRLRGCKEGITSPWRVTGCGVSSAGRFVAWMPRDKFRVSGEYFLFYDADVTPNEANRQ